MPSRFLEDSQRVRIKLKRRKVILSFFYAIFQIVQGLIIHPYQTMQSLVKEKLFVWLTLLPTAVLALVTVGWKWLIVPLVRLFFSCQLHSADSISLSGLMCWEILPFIARWIIFFCLYWQLMLFYLLFRFQRAFAD